jgi:hypothetical protein
MASGWHFAISNKMLKIQAEPQLLRKSDAAERGFWSPRNEFSPLAHMFSMPLASRVTKPAATGFPVRCNYTKSFIMCHLSGQATVTPNRPKMTR